MEGLGLSINAFARELDVTPATVHRVVTEKAANQLTSGTTKAIAQQAANVIKVTDPNNDNLSNPDAKGFNVYVAEGSVIGEIKAVTDANGQVTAAQETKNTTMGNLSDIVSNNFLVFRQQINDVSKRMGDLRTLPNSDGAWARVVAGHPVQEHEQQLPDPADRC